MTMFEDDVTSGSRELLQYLAGPAH